MDLGNRIAAATSRLPCPWKPNGTATRGTLLQLGFFFALNALISVPETWRDAPYLNDVLLHGHQVQSMMDAWYRGMQLLDHWDPTVGLGHPFTRTYASGSHLLLTAIHLLAGQREIVPGLFRWFAYLLWIALPLTTYVGLRWTRLPVSIALATAAMIPWLHAGFRFGIAPESYLWAGHGLIPNLLALVLLAPALGLSARFLASGRGWFPATLSLAGVWFAHVQIGYVASLSTVIWALWGVARSPRKWSAPLARLAMLGGAVMGCCAFFLYPFVTEGAWINKTIREPDHYWNSQGPRVLLDLLRSDWFDAASPLPSLTVMWLLGWVVVMRGAGRKQPWPWLALFWALAFVGRGSLNPLPHLLPFAEKLSFERFGMAAQWCHLIIAGAGVACLAELLGKYLPKRVPSLSLILILLLLPAIWINTRHHWRFSADLEHRIASRWRSMQAEWQPVSELARHRQGRVWVPPTESGPALGVQLYHLPLADHLDHIGFLWHSMSLNADFLYAIDPADAGHRRIFAIRYLVTDPDRPIAGLRQLNGSTHFRLYEDTDARLFRFGQVKEVLPGLPTDHRDRITAWLESDLPETGHYLGFGPADSFPTPDPADEEPPWKPPRILGPQRLEGDVFGYKLRVRTEGPGYLVGSFSHHPGWQAEVNGQAVSVLQVSPSLVAVQLEPGQSEVVLRYRPSPWTRLLIFAAFLAMGSVAARDLWMWRKRSFSRP
ncbi:YfhO family protein [Sulfidibacter corallicola]|uniref:YfhO family protein n=1 Tax=Sulfidibacter corallicola TaxID=2818388 RepID=A0A8A4TLF1_SULCO|nr:hypothetical protein [Sulfidibacter corallicola]QTD49711.1 YfhO family protein [Sulfidibacter corallicola]